MADTERERGFEERLARLEAVVARLVAQVEGGQSARAGARAAPGAAGAPPRDERAGPPRGEDGLPIFEWARDASARAAGAFGVGASPLGARRAEAGDAGDTLAASGERWLGRVGVAFVVLAFGFLFKYAFDQGWIGPAFRLVLGLVAATAMLVIGLRVEGERERYSQYLLGGAVAVYYLVAYASYALYGLMPFAIAFAGMSATTVVAFVLAERQRLPSLAVIGASGGLATPFLVDTGSGNAPALVVYTTLLLAGAGALQFWRGWRVLLAVLGFGGLIVMGAAVEMATRDPLEQAVVAVGVLAAWALFGALPLLRAHLHRLDPEAWPEPASTGNGAGVEPATAASGGAALLRVGCWAASILALAALGELFSLGRRGIVPLFLACSAAYLALAWRLAATRLARDAAAEVASGLLALAIVLFFLDERAFLPLAVLGAAMHLADGRWRMPGLALLSHGVFALLAGSFVARAAVLGAGSGLGVAAEGSPFGTAELTVLGAIIVSAITSLTLPARAQRSVYLFAAHVAFLVWLAHQLAPLELGQELISLCWGVYGIVLLLVALQRGAREAQLLGLGTLGVVALKLVAVDMAQVDVIWRILLFMGFGAAFLGLSYLINRHAAPRG